MSFTGVDGLMETAAFNIRDPVELSVPSYALIVNDSVLVMFSEEISHCFDVCSGIRFVPA